jgi:hypothetical protein
MLKLSISDWGICYTEAADSGKANVWPIASVRHPDRGQGSSKAVQ